MATYVTSCKGNEQLVFKGYLYEFESQKLERVYWRCTEVKRGCKGRAIEDANGLREGRNSHDHPSRTMEIGVKRVLAEIKSEADIQHGQTPHAIVASAVSNLPAAIQGALPSTSAIKKQIQRRRKVFSGQHSAPSSICDFTLSDQFVLTNSGERFLLDDTGGDRDRINVFATDRNLHVLNEDTWIGRPMRYGRTRRAPLFSIDLWNQYNSTLDHLPRTNNSVEGWNRRFSSLLAAANPVIWKFIDTLKSEQTMRELKLS
ncbi:hypothetical protein R1sor_025634 [Riccia sorocarpa]|uniref:FLYWCH-type domain-containing protein n=1 Tax=Riccia sorocarpa TaxID=122646 RepID=A0ABD3GCU0_9MARC